MAPRKVDFSLKVVSLGSTLADLLDSIESLAGIYTSSGYASGGSDPITDTDLTGHNVKVVHIAQFAGMALNLLKLMANQMPTVGKYREQLDAFRDIG